MTKKAIILILLIGACFSLFGQTAEVLIPDAAPYETDEFPLWSQYLFRGTVITVGSFPLTFLLVQSCYDLAKWGLMNDFQLDKAPGIFGFFSNASEVVMSDKEKVGVISTAIGLSVSVAITDLIIELIINSNKKKKHNGL